MRKLTHRLGGGPVAIHFYEGDGDREAFYAWLDQPRKITGFDTETCGLDIYSGDSTFCRLAQFGDETSSWVIPARYLDVIQRGVLQAKHLVMHNAPHDVHTADRHLGLPLEEVHTKTIDTMILSHIVDPRGKEDGGVGHGLKDLAAYYVDPDAPDGEKALKAVFAENKWTGGAGWSEIAEDHEAFWLYAGIDTIITVRLYNALLAFLAGFERLSRFEHKLQRLLAKMERRGILLDVEYTAKLQHELTTTVDDNTARITQMVRELGVAKLTPRAQRMASDAVVTALGGTPPKRRKSKGALYAPVSAESNQVIVEGLLAMGETLTLRTKSGALSVDKDVLNELCDVNKDGERLELREPNPLAVMVKAAKRANKWNSSYATAMLDTRDPADRIHPKIAGLKARTARMSISRPPFQQLPSSGAQIRDCLVADPGQLLISCDYEQVEMRLLAAMAQEHQMMHAIAEGVDLHDMTATILFGIGFTKKQRKMAKNAGFGKVYGGGAATLAKQVGVSVDQARDVIKGYDDAFPGVKQYGWKLQDMAKRDKNLAITTPLLGRRLPVDEDRIYAATNYMIQSTARDFFAQALLDLADAGLEEHLLLPVHDEVIAQAFPEDADEVAKLIGETMTTSYQGVLLAAEGEVVGTKWGDAYRYCPEGHGLKYRVHGGLYCPKCP